MKLYLATKNGHKVTEINEIMKKFKIKVEQLAVEKEEPSDMTIQEVAAYSAQKIANQCKKTVIVDDTGIFFEAYKDFPGSRPKFVFESIGYDGIFRLLKGKNTKAYFLTAAAYARPGKEPKLFEGRSNGRIALKVYNPKKDRMPYERIFIPDGFNKTLSDLSLEEKNKISHRAKAFQKLGRWLNDNRHN